MVGSAFERSPQDFTVTLTGTMFVSLTLPNGKAIPNASVTLENPLGTLVLHTDARGKFQQSGLPSGMYYVTPSLPGYTFTPSVATPTLGSGGTVTLSFVSKVAAPLLSSVNPKRGAAGTTVTIAGTGFGAQDPQYSTVKFQTSTTALPATILCWNTTACPGHIRVTAPSVTNGALVTVSTLNGTSNALDFTFPPPTTPVRVFATGSFNPLIFSTFVFSSSNAKVAKYSLVIMNNQDIWYYVTPVVTGTGLTSTQNSPNLTNAFLLGPGATMDFGVVTFPRTTSLTFNADASVDSHSASVSVCRCRRRLLM